MRHLWHGLCIIIFSQGDIIKGNKMITKEQQIQVVSQLRNITSQSDWESLKMLAVIDNVIAQFTWNTEELSGLILKLWERLENKN